jgi:hypothetical protein
MLTLPPSCRIYLCPQPCGMRKGYDGLHAEVHRRGRASYMLVGSDDGGRNLARLMTLAHTTEACGKNPEHDLADVLVRILDHPVNRLDELLPQNWRPPATG